MARCWCAAVSFLGVLIRGCLRYTSGMRRVVDVLQKRKLKGPLALLSYALSIAINLMGHTSPLLACLCIGLAVAWTIYLFLPDIKKLKIVHPKGTVVESPGWMYIFAISAIVMAIFAIYKVYSSAKYQPTGITAREFSQQYISGKYFHVYELAGADNVIEGRTFEDCWIYGPAVLATTSNTNISASVFNSSIDMLLLPIVVPQRVGQGSRIILLRDCRFRRCHFVGITFVASATDIQKYKNENYGPGTSHPYEYPPLQ